MCFHDAAPVPGSEMCSAIATAMLDVFQRVHQVRDENQYASETKGDAGPDTINKTYRCQLAERLRFLFCLFLSAVSAPPGILLLVSVASVMADGCHCPLL